MRLTCIVLDADAGQVGGSAPNCKCFVSVEAAKLGQNHTINLYPIHYCLIKRQNADGTVKLVARRKATEVGITAFKCLFV